MREDWIECTFEDLLDYEQPTKYIVKEEDYNDKYPTPVLTAGKGFIKGYTKENFGIFDNLPTIIFDDFTTASQFVNFKFKVKSSAMKILLPKSNLVNLKFVFGAMQVNKVRSETHKRYWISEFSKIYFGLPPLPEQRAIVKKTEQLFSALDASISDLKKAQGQLKIYRQAVLKKAFEGEFTKEWRKRNKNIPTAKQILESIQETRNHYYQLQLEEWKNVVKKWEQNGILEKKPTKPSKPKIIENIDTYEINEYNLSNIYEWTRFANITLKIGDVDHKMPKAVEKGIPYLSTSNILENGNIDYKNAKLISEIDYNNLSVKIKPEQDDIIFPRYGTIGRNVIVKENKKFLVSYSCAIIKIVPNQILSKFLLYYTFSPIIKKEIRRYIVETTQANIGIASIEKFIVPIVPFEEQHQIVREIESRLSVCDAVEQQIKTSLEKAEALRQSILKKAFAGALLTQAELEACRKEPDYEPASVLLEKIKAEKNGKKKTDKEKAVIPAKPAVAATGKISADIQAGLIAKVIRLHEDNPKHHTLLTHVKCEKLSHLVEYHLQIPLGRQPVKDAAGPDDYPRLKKVEHRAKMAGYFSIQKNKIGHTYVSGKGIGKAITQFEKNLSEGQKQRVDQLLHLFLTFDLEQAEIVATVYAAWNNLLILGKNKPTDQEIVQEARYNWSDRKLGLEEHRFYKAIEWMQKDTVNLVPTGYGTLVDFPKKKK